LQPKTRIVIPTEAAQELFEEVRAGIEQTALPAGSYFGHAFARHDIRFFW
jgi:hypothetical protein